MLAALHVTNGDSTVQTLRATGLVEHILAWRDVLHEGPVPEGDDDELRRVRAQFLADDDVSAAETLTALAERDRTLEDHRQGEYVLWFEADLYDQLQLIQILARLARLGVPPAPITLICIGEHLGIAHFGGLGELNAEQLKALPSTAASRVTATAIEHSTRAWTAFRARAPTGLNQIAASQSADLRFLAEAFDRLCREYPSTRDGLSLTERRILAAVEDGAPTAGTAFIRTAAREARPFLGDRWAYDAITRLARAEAPLLELDHGGETVDRRSRLHVTDAGQRVLAGELDHVEINGIDRWIGGVRLTGSQPRWRWNEGIESITAVRNQRDRSGSRPGSTDDAK